MLIHPTSSERQQYLHRAPGGRCLANPPVGLFIVEGSDALDFIHRMSTNNVKGLAEGKGITTVFTSDKGKIIDVVDLYRFDNRLYMVHSEGTDTKIREIFDKFVIMEDVSLRKDEDHTCLLELDEQSDDMKIGPGENGNLTMSSPRILPSGAIVYNTIENTSYKSYYLIDIKQYNCLRIEQNIVLYGSDFDDTVNPLESNMYDFISFTKGCYVGQEVIARIDTYKKSKRLLAGVVLDEVIEDRVIESRQKWGELLPVLLADGSTAGNVTSGGYSYELERSIFMARLTRGNELTGTRVTIPMGGRTYTGSVTELPFIKKPTFGDKNG
jgi:tRNA-modifying protein YgfZ